MPYKVSFFWKQTDVLEGGWTENFWSNAGSVSELLPAINDLRFALLQIHGNQAQNPVVRYSDALNFREGDIITYAPFDPADFTATSDSDYLSTALLLKSYHAGSQRAINQWVRGIWDSQIVRGGLYKPIAGYSGHVANFCALLVSGPWAHRTLTLPRQKTNVNGLNLTTGLLAVDANAFYPDNSTGYIRIKGFEHNKYVNKIWRATKQDATHFQLNFWDAAKAGLAPPGPNPTAWLISFSFLKITKAEIKRATSHYTGKPSFLHGGHH